jgi:hypothetical protein
MAAMFGPMFEGMKSYDEGGQVGLGDLLLGGKKPAGSTTPTDILLGQMGIGASAPDAALSQLYGAVINPKPGDGQQHYLGWAGMLTPGGVTPGWMPHKMHGNDQPPGPYQHLGSIPGQSGEFLTRIMGGGLDLNPGSHPNHPPGMSDSDWWRATGQGQINPGVKLDPSMTRIGGASRWGVAGNTLATVLEFMNSPGRTPSLLGGLLPRNPFFEFTLPRFAQGGEVMAKLHEGEHVLTADDVGAMGGQGNVYAFRDALHKGLGFAEGGSVASASNISMRSNPGQWAGQQAFAHLGAALGGFSIGNSDAQRAYAQPGSVIYDMSINMNGTSVGDHAGIKQSIQEAQMQRFYSASSGLPAATAY